MKNQVKLILVFILTPFVWMHAQEQGDKLKTYSVGVRIAHLYDLPSYNFDSDLSTDLKGLNGSNTSFDLGLDLYGEAQLTPLIGFQAGLRFGGLSGSNEVEYYDNSFAEFYTDMIFILSNLDKNRIDSRLNYYAKLGLGVGGFNADRYLVIDNSHNGGQRGKFWDSRVGAGIQYELTSDLRLELDAAYNVAFHDGFDGFNHSTGSDPYFSSGVGVAYTFGVKEDKPMYATNLFAPEYTGQEVQRDNQARHDSLMSRLLSLSESMEVLNTELQNQQGMMSQQAQLLDAQRENLELQQERISEQEKLILELRQAEVKAETLVVKEPVTFWEEELNQVQVYFEFDSDLLTSETQRILRQAIDGGNVDITLIGYASVEGQPLYNDLLKRRRVKQVKDFLVTTLEVEPSRIVELMAGSVEDLKENNYLNRKVVVKYQSSPELSTQR